MSNKPALFLVKTALTMGLIAALSVILFVVQGPQPKRNVAVAADSPPIIFIVVETLRADHLAAYGYGRHTMPNLENLANDGIIFDRAIVAAPWTLPSVSSILTGLAPSVHGVTKYEDVLPDQVETLAETLKAAGYYTAFYGVNSLFEADRNLEQGFDHYYGIDEIPGVQLNERLAAFFTDRPQGQPFFLYAHYFEPHCRYSPPPEMHEMYWPPPAGLRTGRTMNSTQFRTMHECFHLSRQSGEPIYELDYYLAEYDAEIRYVDHLIGIFIERLKTAGLYDSSLIVFVGDHGEEFWEDGTFGHGRSLNEQAIHVPLFIKPPKSAQPMRHQPPVSTLDLVPTVLSELGLKAPDILQGQALNALWDPNKMALESKSVFSETDYNSFHYRSVHKGSYKLILPLDGQAPTLHRVLKGSTQGPDLAGQEPEIVQNMLLELTQHMEENKHKGSTLGHETAPLSTAVEEQLRALGYTF